jgi:hypothetical protein
VDIVFPRRAAALFVIGLLALASAGLGDGHQAPAPVPLSAADGDRFDKKLAAIDRYGTQAATTPFRADQARRTTVTEAETNSYLRFKIPSQLPVGLLDPYIAALGEGRVFANGTLDLDAVRRGAASTTLELSRWLTGRVPVTVTGVLRTGIGDHCGHPHAKGAAPAVGQFLHAFGRGPQRFFPRLPARAAGRNSRD